MSLNKFVSKKFVPTAATLTAKTGYSVDFNTVAFNASINNGQYLLQGTVNLNTTVSQSDFYLDIVCPSFDNLFDADTVLIPTIDESKIFNHSKAGESIASSPTQYNAWGVSCPVAGTVRCFFRGQRNNQVGANIFCTVKVSVNSLL
jgi:hypothetical protein